MPGLTARRRLIKRANNGGVAKARMAMKGREGGRRGGKEERQEWWKRWKERKQMREEKKGRRECSESRNENLIEKETESKETREKMKVRQQQG